MEDVKTKEKDGIVESDEVRKREVKGDRSMYKGRS